MTKQSCSTSEVQLVLPSLGSTTLVRRPLSSPANMDAKMHPGQMVLPLAYCHDLSLFKPIDAPCVIVNRDRGSRCESGGHRTPAQGQLFSHVSRQPRDEREIKVWQLLEFLQRAKVITAFAYEPDELVLGVEDGYISGALRSDFRIWFPDSPRELYLEMTYTMNPTKLDEKRRRIQLAEGCNDVRVLLMHRQMIQPLLRVETDRFAAGILWGYLRDARDAIAEEVVSQAA